MGTRRVAGQRATALLSAVLLLISGQMVVTGPAAAEDVLPDWVAELDRATAAEEPAPVPWREPSPVPPTDRDVPAPTAEFAFPEPALWEATLGLAGAARLAGDRPVRLAAGAARVVGEPVQVEVLGRAAAARAGASGFVFTATPSAGTAGRLPVTLTVDYSGFAEAYGGGYADRLQVLALPQCAVADRVPAGCPAGEPLPVDNDLIGQTLTVDVADLAEPDAGGPSVFAVTAAVGGETGTFAATELSITGSWQVAPGSGAFSYSYPIDVPAVPGGSAPSVGLSYSSAAIDGLTLATNTQASKNGVGWSDFANAFIERSYEPCIWTVGTTDLCWKSDNATISLAGVSGPLVPVNSEHTEWKVLADPGWRIERLTGAPYTDIYQQQYWKATGPDGTIYYFGYGHMPGRKTNSTLGVPVLADNPGEPCRGPGEVVGACHQGWRWYLDRVVDPDGNIQSYLYERETNYYRAIGGIGKNEPYHRSASLTEIIYGGQGWNSGQYAARVLFGRQWRCDALESCPAPTAGNGSRFPDVPNDLICTATSACSVFAPAFFSGRRYDYVHVDVRVGNGWKPVARTNIYLGFGDGANGVVKKLRMESLLHVALAFGSLNIYPPTTFGYDWFDNRADHSNNIPKAMRHHRITRVTNPFGGRIDVTYDFNRHCSTTYNPWPRWDVNVMDCFPQTSRDGSHLRIGVFNKYLVTTVIESPGVGSPPMTTSYAYEGDPAWAFDTGAFARDEDEAGWSVWRGYGTVTITKGSSRTRVQVFRGWDQDPMLVQDAGGNWVPLGHRDSHVTASDGSVYVDHHTLAGRVLEEQQLGPLDSVPDAVLESRIHRYEKRIRHDPGPDYLFDAEWVGLASTTERVATAPGVFRERRSQTTYNDNLQPTTTLEEGWLDRSGDERCSITTYADNPDAGMFVYPAVNESVAGDCDSTELLSRSETYYDGSATLGSLPTRGNPTRERTLVDGGRWSQTTTEYDDLGRPVRVTGPTGAVTTTAHTVTAGAWAGQIPIRTTETNHLGYQSVTDWVPEFGVPSRERDANGNVTSYSYDEFGRLVMVWLPTEPLAFLEPSYRFSYDVESRAVRSRRLISESRCCTNLAFEDAWVIYDGFWRERQAQSLSTVAGRALVSETTYDERGLVKDETVEQAVPGTPGTYLPGGSSWQNRTRHQYDELGREVATQWFRGAAVAHETTTEYGVDAVTVTGPNGRVARERVDGLGRTVSVSEFDGHSWVSSSYQYDLADRLTAVTDPDNNRIHYSYNLAGWRTGQQDPDRGNASFGYDDAGRQTSVVDARGNRIHTGYDPLGRPVERRAGSPTGPLLASWQYDSAPGGIGALHREVTHTSDGDWVSETLGYDGRGRPTGSKLVVPAGIPGLSGEYQVGQTYDRRSDRIRSVSYPAVGDLPAETVTTDYNGLGLPTRLAGLAEYVWGVSYDDRGRQVSAGFGPRPGGATWLAKSWTYDGDQRLAGAETYVAGSTAPGGIVSDHELAFDPAGNLSEKLVRQEGRQWRECFGYDPRGRLTSAHTVTAASTCVGGTPGTGDRPYQHSYQYSADGRLTERVEDGTATAYSYPDPGEPHPHAPTRVGVDSYAWDEAGSLVSRTVAGASETFSWDVQGRLDSVTGPDGTTEFVYDASGQRMLRRSPDGRTTLYVAGHEVTANADGSSVTAVRPYTFDGELVAVRTAAGVEYLVTDATGSVEMAVPSGGVPAATRSYAPFGRVRAQDGVFATDRGFIGQIEDESTGLSYLNARYFDPVVGLFIAADPVYDTTKVQSLNPYSYSVNSPTTLSDPSGLISTYSHGLEVENARLRAQNKELIGHIGRLGNHIEQLQDVIRKQQRYINQLMTHIRALEAEIARQASIIRKLQARVAYLERVVVYQQRVISKLRHIVAKQDRLIRHQAGIIQQQRGQIIKLGARLAAVGVVAGIRAVIGAVVRGVMAGVRAGVNRAMSRMVGLRAGAVQQSSGGGGDDDCGWGWSGVANCLQRGGHVVRFAANAVNPVGTIPAVAYAYAMGGGCDMSSGLMVRCSGLNYAWADGPGSIFAWGNVAMSHESKECAARYMRHESTHATQQAMTGSAWPLVYGADWVLHGGDRSAMWTEDWAGLEGGGYGTDVC